MEFDLSKLIDASVLIKACETEDELGTVLRIHLCFETILTTFLEPKKNSFVKIPNTYAGKLSLSVAFGLPIVFAEIFKQINKIRNSLAHEPNSELSNSDVLELAKKVDTLSSVVTDFKKVSERYVEIPSRAADKRFSFGEAGAQIDFLLAAITGYSEIVKWVVIDSAIKQKGYHQGW